MHSVRESESNNKSKSVIVFHRWWSIETSFHNSIWVIYCMHVKYNAKSEIKSLFSTHPLVSDLPRQVHTFFKRSHISIHLHTCRERKSTTHFVSLWFRFCRIYLNIHDIWKRLCFWAWGAYMQSITNISIIYVGGATVIITCMGREYCWLLNFHLAVKIMEFNLFLC